ncbi:Aldo/keto reductase [Penicillium argentinense]|uniref:Aldo/keto reductase n=1 Tax=Penicillium argentinense TaxID=1131581 RepID=A0A9W9KNL8_9EURO|nr:Aldo/keto reductase [Penicillium argentinense]KAJ5112138.1 Aldo/keto reductase [Penicillium argentinense]
MELGKSGLKVSKIVLGCMTYGDPNWQPWITDETAALPLIKHAYDQGINTWDVADTYSNGKSEEILGAALKKYDIPRSKVVIMSKCFHEVDESRGPLNAADFGINDGIRVNRVGLSRKHIFDAVERSVERLGTYIDVLQIHRLDRDTPMEEIMRALNDVIESGNVRYIGASSMAAWEFQMLQNIAEEKGWHKFISMQGFYNLLYREEEREMFPYCRATGVGLLPWSPLAAGVLAHAWTDRSDKREQQDVFLKALFRSQEDKSAEEIVSRVGQVAEKKGISMAQVATAWVLAQKGSAPILGLDSIDRIDQAVKAIKVELTEKEISFLEEPYLPKQAIAF